MTGLSYRQLVHMERATQRKRWLLWTFATAAGLGIGAGLAEVVSSSLSSESGLRDLLFSPRWQISVGFSLGAPALLVQYVILRAFVPGAVQWIPRTTLGLAIGAGVGAFVGLALALVVIFIGFGCEAVFSDGCAEGVSFLALPMAGGAAGAVAGGIMGMLLRLDKREWLQDWTWPLVKAWAGIGAVFWLIAPLLLTEPFSEAGLLDTDATMASIALAGVAGLAAGAVRRALREAFRQDGTGRIECPTGTRRRPTARGTRPRACRAVHA